MFYTQGVKVPVVYDNILEILLNPFTEIDCSHFDVNIKGYLVSANSSVNVFLLDSIKD